MKMIQTVLKNFSRKASTRLYPIEVREPFEESRGELVNKIEDCIFCKSCQIKCPSQCIEVDKTTATWNYDPFACVYCGLCVAACPTNCLSQEKKYRAPVRDRLFISLKGEVKVKKKAAKKDAPKAEAKAEAKEEAPKETPKEAPEKAAKKAPAKKAKGKK